MTMPAEDGQTLGILTDDDGVATRVRHRRCAGAARSAALRPPLRQMGGDTAAIARGETVFGDIGRASCHVPALEGSSGPFRCSDLLLHEVTAPGTAGDRRASAAMDELRTPPLWGVSTSGPWLHDGSANPRRSHRQALGEATASAEAYQTLSGSDADLILFLEPARAPARPCTPKRTAALAGLSLPAGCSDAGHEAPKSSCGARRRPSARPTPTRGAPRLPSTASRCALCPDTGAVPRHASPSPFA